MFGRNVVPILLGVGLLLAVLGVVRAAEVTIEPGLKVFPHDPVVDTSLITVTVDPGLITYAEMAFSHDHGAYLPWEPFCPVRQWMVNEPERTYQDYLANLNNGQAFSRWNNEYGAVAWGESFILDSLLNMYQATGHETYLATFVDHADAVIAQGDDQAGRPDYRGLRLSGWGTSGSVTLARTVFSDTLGQPAVEVLGRPALGQNHIAVRLSLAPTMNGSLWVLDVHRSTPGRMGTVLSDTSPLHTPPVWDVEGFPERLESGDTVAYDVYYPWHKISEIRLYGIEGQDVRADDFELYTAMHSDSGEYTQILSFTLQSLIDHGQPVLSIQDFSSFGRYWKIRYVGEEPIVLGVEPQDLIRVYEVDLPPLSEQFSAPDIEALAQDVEQQSALVRMQLVGTEPPQLGSPWRFLAPRRYRMALHTGLITYPLLGFSLIVEQQGLDSWQSRAQQYLQYARAAVDSHDDEWYNLSATAGYYVFRQDSPVWCNGVNLPFNQQAAIGRSLLLMYDLTGEERYRDRVRQIANVFRDALIYDQETDSYWWHYWFGEGYEGWRDVEGRFVSTYDGFRSVESISYASLDIDFALMAYARGLVFSSDDVARLANTFLHHLTSVDGELRYYVDGHSTALVPSEIEDGELMVTEFPGLVLGTLTTGGTYDDKMTATEYLELTEIVPAVYQRVEVVRPVPPTSQNSGRAPYGLAQLLYHATWRLNPEPGDHTLCVQVRDTQEDVAGPWCVDVALDLWRSYLPVVIRPGVAPE